tara:strand:- start:1068 stop:1211 length:144 start_codon:yes stop_codon:yes gene_type:complete
MAIVSKFLFDTAKCNGVMPAQMRRKIEFDMSLEMYLTYKYDPLISMP